MAASGGKGGGGKAGAIRAGGAFVEIFADDMSVIRALERLKGYLNSVGRMSKIAGAAAIASGTAVLAPIGAMFQSVVSRDVDMARLANRFGDTVENMSALVYAADATGVSFEHFKDVLENLPERVDDAVRGGGEAAEVFQRMGISAQQFMNLPLSEKFTSLADGLQGFTDDSKNSILGKLFSDKGQMFREMMDGGSGNIKKLMAEAGSVGAVVSAQDAANAMKVNSAMNRAWAAAKGVAYSIGAALLPEASVITKASDWVVKAAGSVRDFVAENKQMVMNVIMGGVAVIGLGAALIGLGYGFNFLAMAVGGIAQALLFIKATAGLALGSLLGVKAAVALLGFAFSPLGIAVAGTAVIMALLWELFSHTETYAKMLREFADVWNFVKDTALQAWSGIRDAISAGDLQLAFRIAVQGLTVIWAGLIQQLTAKWNIFKGFFVDAWNDAVMLFKLGWNGAQGAVGDAFLAMLQMLVGQFESTFATLFEWMAKGARTVGAESIANELDMFKDLANKGQLSSVFSDARKELAKDTQKESFAITNGRQAEQEAANASRAGSQAAADAVLAEARANLAASVAEAKSAADKAHAAANAANLTKAQLGPVLSDLTRGAQGARDFTKIFSAGDSVNERILQSNLKNGDKIESVKDAIVSGFNGMAVPSTLELRFGQ